MNAQSGDPFTQWEDFEPELVIGLVGAVGTELTRVSEVLEHQLGLAGYGVRQIRISSEVIPRLQDVDFDEKDSFDRISQLMTAGNKAREAAEDNSVLALGAASVISALRKTDDKRNPTPLRRTAFIVRSLKRPEEVERLRTIYPQGFMLLGVHSEEARRLEHLEKDLNISPAKAKALIQRDADESRVPHGQRLNRTFYLSDFFVRLGPDNDKLKADLRRLVELLFGHPHLTPSFDEYAMFLAFAASLRSADLSRQVGAVIAREKQILATGANDCPRAGGGLYWPEEDAQGRLRDRENGRDYMRGVDANKREQQRIIQGIREIGQRKGLDVEKLRETLSESRIRDLIEYSRVVHAEMDALLSCARINVSTQSASLYCTTFPCHICAKHIVAAGVERVVYIEPYEKSRALELHDDSIKLGFDCDDDRVLFEPFVGIGPRRFFDLFSMQLGSGYDIVRKDDDGNTRHWSLETARLRLRMWPRSYLDDELDACDLFQKHLKKPGGGDAN